MTLRSPQPKPVFSVGLMAIAVLGCVGVSSDASRAALVPTQTATSIAPSPIPTTAAPTTILTGAVASATVVPPGVQPAFDGVGAGGEPSLAPANTVVIGGPRVDVGTEQATTFVFSATAGQSISLRSNRAWKLEDPLGREVAADESRAISIDDSGRYLVRAAPGLRAPASLAIVSIDPSAIVSDISVGQVISVSTGELRNHYARVPLRGGQRYRLIVPNGQGGASFCAVGTTGTFNGERYCVGSSTLLNGPASSTTFVLRSDQVMELTGTVSAGDDGSIPQTIRAQIDEALNDVLADTKSNAVVELEPKDGQGVVVPFWGSPSERAVL